VPKLPPRSPAGSNSRGDRDQKTDSARESRGPGRLLWSGAQAEKVYIGQSTRMSMPEGSKGMLFKRRDREDDAGEDAAHAADWPRRVATETKRGGPSLARKQAEPRRIWPEISPNKGLGPDAMGGERRRVGEKRRVRGKRRTSTSPDERGSGQAAFLPQKAGEQRRKGFNCGGRESGGRESSAERCEGAAASGWNCPGGLSNPLNSIAAGEGHAGDRPLAP